MNVETFAVGIMPTNCYVLTDDSGLGLIVDPAAQKLVRDCEEYLEEEKALELDLKEREEIIRKETPDDVKKGGYL